MVKHVVMWKVKDSANKSNDIQKLKSALDGLKDKIMEIIDLEVGIDFAKKGDTSVDIILNSSFASIQDLELYQKHPEHLKVVEIIRSLTIEKRVVDYNF